MSRERVLMRRAGKDHRCWTFENNFSSDVDDYRCTRLIVKGEQHVVSTIYPGHESGYAADAPLTAHFCMPCSERWLNLRDGLARTASQRTTHNAEVGA